MPIDIPTPIEAQITRRKHEEQIRAEDKQRQARSVMGLTNACASILTQAYVRFPVFVDIESYDAIPRAIVKADLENKGWIVEVVDAIPADCDLCREKHFKIQPKEKE